MQHKYKTGDFAVFVKTWSHSKISRWPRKGEVIKIVETWYDDHPLFSCYDRFFINRGAFSFEYIRPATKKEEISWYIDRDFGELGYYKKFCALSGKKSP